MIAKFIFKSDFAELGGLFSAEIRLKTLRWIIMKKFKFYANYLFLNLILLRTGWQFGAVKRLKATIN